MKTQTSYYFRTSEGTAITFRKACLGYGRRAVINDIDLELAVGEFLGIVGPNGAGNTTLLKAMLGIIRPMRGEVVRTSSERFSYVPQQQSIDEIYPLSAMDVAMMGRYAMLGAISRPSRKDREVVTQCLDLTGIADLAPRPFRELSGGQKQRVLIARALTSEPRVLILDEPTNDMDIGSEHAIMELLKSLQTETGVTIVMVSHLLNVVANYADKLALVDGGLRLLGRTGEVLTDGNLSDIYQVRAQVVRVGDRIVVMTGGKND